MHPPAEKNAGKARQLFGDLLGATAIGEHVSNRRRRRAAPRPVIHGMRPELTDAGTMSSGIEHQHRRLAAEHARRGLNYAEAHKGPEPPGGTVHPASECRAATVNALTGQNQHLAVQRQIPGEL